MQLNGSQIVMECLLEQGVDTIFGYPGGAILNIYDALYEYEKQGKIKHVLTSHEQGASHAADGYARATGKTGVCFATSGPGATNLVTGIATAYMDSVPMVAITANVATNLIGRDTFQEIDIAGVCIPITKYSFLVEDVNTLADTIRRAFRIAQEGRKGPVLVDITKDVTAAKTSYEKKASVEVERVSDTITEEDLTLAASLITKSKKPYIFVGGGACISEASDEVAALAELIDAPVCDTLMGKGCYPGTGERYTGMLGMHGTKTSAMVLGECDLLIVIGSRFSDRVICNPNTFAKGTRIIHIEIDPAEIGKNISVYHHVTGDVKHAIARLNELLPEDLTSGLNSF